MGDSSRRGPDDRYEEARDSGLATSFDRPRLNGLPFSRRPSPTGLRRRRHRRCHRRRFAKEFRGSFDGGGGGGGGGGDGGNGNGNGNDVQPEKEEDEGDVSFSEGREGWGGQVSERARRGPGPRPTAVVCVRVHEATRGVGKLVCRIESLADEGDESRLGHRYITCLCLRRCSTPSLSPSLSISLNDGYTESPCLEAPARFVRPDFEREMREALRSLHE
jgi:hypothetical protein